MGYSGSHDLQTKCFRIYCIRRYRGYEGLTSLPSEERLNPSTISWFSITPSNKSRSTGAVTAWQGYICALGVHDGLSTFNSVERYHPTTKMCPDALPMLTKRCRLGVAILEEKLYACGGYDSSSFL